MHVCVLYCRPVCREQRNLSDLCVDPLPCVWSVCDTDDFGSHRSRRLGHRSECERGHMIEVITCARVLHQIYSSSLFLQFRTSQWKKTWDCMKVSSLLWNHTGVWETFQLGRGGRDRTFRPSPCSPGKFGGPASQSVWLHPQKVAPGVLLLSQWVPCYHQLWGSGFC